MGDARVRAWLAVAAWTGVILLLSGDAFSADQTASLLGPILRALLPDLDAAALAALHGAIRKAAHVAEYGVLALLVLRALRAGAAERAPAAAVLPSLLFVTGVAVLDELHQSLSATRTGSAADVALDAAGGGLALVAALAWHGARAKP